MREYLMRASTNNRLDTPSNSLSRSANNMEGSSVERQKIVLEVSVDKHYGHHAMRHVVNSFRKRTCPREAFGAAHPVYFDTPPLLAGCGKTSNSERRSYPQRLNPDIITITYGRPAGRPLQRV
jgi:hypothetical protein